MKRLVLCAAMLLAVPASAQTADQETASANTQTVAPDIPRVADQPHVLSACAVRKRKLTCDNMQSHSGFIFTTNLRNGRDKLQYQMSAMSRLLQNEDFAAIFEGQVRANMEEAIPLAAGIIGWDMEHPGTIEMLEAANAALETLVISPEEQKRDPDSDDLMAMVGMQKVEFQGGSFYANRSSIMNGYSLYIERPPKNMRKKKK